MTRSGARIAIVTHDYPPLDGGIARLCHELARGLPNFGWDVHVVTRAVSGPVAHTPPEGVTEHRVWDARPGRELASYAVLRRLVPDLVLTATWYPEGLLASAALRTRTNAALVVLAHGTELLAPPQRWRRRWWPLLQRRVLERSADLVLANSRYTAELTQQSAPRAQVAWRPLGVDTARFYPGSAVPMQEDAPLTLLTVARLERYKGQDTVLHALARLPAAVRKRWRYLIAGRGPDEAELRALTKELNLESQVTFLGFVDELTLPSLYREADAFVMLSRFGDKDRAVEGFGLSFLEAQASGLPVIATRSGGIESAVEHGDSGILLDDPAHSADALAMQLESWSASPSTLRSMGQAARLRAERDFGWPVYLRACDALFKPLLRT